MRSRNDSNAGRGQFSRDPRTPHRFDRSAPASSGPATQTERREGPGCHRQVGLEDGFGAHRDAPLRRDGLGAHRKLLSCISPSESRTPHAATVTVHRDLAQHCQRHRTRKCLPATQVGRGLTHVLLSRYHESAGAGVRPSAPNGRRSWRSVRWCAPPASARQSAARRP